MSFQFPITRSQQSAASNQHPATRSQQPAPGSQQPATRSQKLKAKGRGTSKGQYFSFDAIIASVVFVLTVLALMSYWNSVKAGMETYSDETTKEAIRISDLLLSPPEPLEIKDCSGTADKEVKRLGFAVSWENRQLSKQLLKSCQSITQENLRSLLGTPYNVSVFINSSSGLFDAIQIGNSFEDTSQSKNVAKVRRIVAVRDDKGEANPATMDIFVYQ
ncbi:TPA: hypothetical protein HA238_00835 [Candidatus Micrarchaeota archaeon]|nr:hypothetical protein [Candidatus Micrarchaeota archaeon]